MSIYELCGFIGVALLVYAYLRLQTGKWRGDIWQYPATNLSGALLILVSLYETPNIPSIAIELVWISISLYGLWRCWRMK
jgi:uncharacterized membrane protein